MRILSIIAACFYFSSIHATLFYDINTNFLLQCRLSSQHHNRIAFENRRIKKVIYPEGLISIRLEEESGQIFVQSLVDNPPITTISLVTSDGVVQDIELSFGEGSAEILVLREPAEIVSVNCCLVPQVPVGSYDTLADVIQGMKCGYFPPEYVAYECFPRKVYKIAPGLILSAEYELIGPRNTLYIAYIYNTDRCQKTLREADINMPGGAWVYLDKPCLKPKEKTIAIFSKDRS